MRYRFGHLCLDTQRLELSGAGRPIKLRRQAFQVLAYLLRHRERVVPTQELLEHLWPEQFVGDEALKSCVKALRKALGERDRPALRAHAVRPGLWLCGGCGGMPARARRPLPWSRALRRAAAGRLCRPLHRVRAAPARISLPPSPARPPTPSPLPTGERQQATVLCGLLAHTTTLSDQLGVAACRHLIQTFRTLAQECVQRYQGTMQALGDEGVLALFGVPVAQREHGLARRAGGPGAAAAGLGQCAPNRPASPSRGSPPVWACTRAGWWRVPPGRAPAGRAARGGHDAGGPARAGASRPGEPGGECHDPAAPAGQRARHPPRAWSRCLATRRPS